MITDSFDPCREAIINPNIREDLPQFDACIMTFSWKIEQYVIKKFNCEEIALLHNADGDTKLWKFEYNGKKFAFAKTPVGAPVAAGRIEDTLTFIRTKKYICFGGAGCLDREIARGKVMIPTEAYRDEGTSYHYAPASDYITVKNHETVERFMKESGLPYVAGKTWTTDAFYRETRRNFEQHKADGCISVEMECAALQAVCDFRGLELYMFFTGGDLLDAPEWDFRHAFTGDEGTQHDSRLFTIGLELADHVTTKG